MFSTGSIFPFVNDFKLPYEGREMITFPVKSADDLISLGNTTKCFWHFLNLWQWDCLHRYFIMGHPASLETLLPRNDCSIVCLSYAQWCGMLSGMRFIHGCSCLILCFLPRFPSCGSQWCKPNPCPLCLTELFWGSITGFCHCWCCRCFFVWKGQIFFLAQTFTLFPFWSYTGVLSDTLWIHFMCFTRFNLYIISNVWKALYGHFGISYHSPSYFKKYMYLWT